MKRQIRTWAAALAVAVGAGVAVQSAQAAQQGLPGETKEQRDARMAWWREAKFGMFIHWGVYSVPAGTYDGRQIGGIGEWIMHGGRIPVARYAEYTKQFNPVKFNADEWVAVAKKAGMKYIVITSKHHDGFAMFHSKASPYNIYDATPFKRDPLAELAAACTRQGIRLGFYYSQCQDWHHPGGEAFGGHWDKAQDGDFDAYLRDIAVPQVREILSNYGPVAVLWWDTPTGLMTKERADLLAEQLKLQPGIIFNNRLGGGQPGDTETPEQTIPATGFPGRDWETCMTMNDTWGFKSYDQNWKSVETILRNLVDIASKGGNYLLNVGPTSEGVIPAPSVERLAAVGKWMDANGEAIYGTAASPFKKLAWGRCTQKPGKLYLTVFDWPKDGKLVVPMETRIAKAYLLAAPGGALTCTGLDHAQQIQLPAQAPDPVASVVVAEIEGAPQPAEQPLRQAADGTILLKAADAEIVGREAKVEGGGDEQNVGFWTDSNDAVKWTVQVDKPGIFQVELVQACETGTAGTEYTVSAGGQTLAGKVEGTGSWKDYKTVKLGALKIEQAGRVTICIKPVTKPNFAVMNLRSLTLKP